MKKEMVNTLTTLGTTGAADEHISVSTAGRHAHQTTNKQKGNADGSMDCYRKHQ